MKRTLLLFMLAALLARSGSSHAQVSVTSLPYAPAATDFDAYNPNSASNMSATIPTGWTASCSGSPAYNGRATGSGIGGGYYAYGTGTDFSLGALRSTAAGDIIYSVSFTNNSGSTINSITLSWDYKQWRYANTSGWNVFGTGQLAGNATLDSKDFTGTASGINGSVTTTGVASFTLSGLNIANNQTFGVEWVTTDATGSDNGIALDNFSISAVHSSPLPIGLLSFNAQRQSSADYLTWSTSCNSNARLFTIERSNGSDAFVDAGRVDAASTICNGNYAYAFDLPAIATGRTLYRLALLDASGIITYSPTVDLVNAVVSNADIIHVAPIPTKGLLQVSGVGVGSTWVICDILGRTLKRGFFDAAAIYVSDLPVGPYFLLCEGARPIRFLKQ